MSLNVAAVAAALLSGGTVLCLTIWAAGRRVTEADRVAARLSQYGRPTEVTPARVRTGNPVRDAVEGVSALITPLLARSSHTGKLADDLQKADLKLKSSEWVVAVAGVGIALGLLLTLRFATPVMLLIGPVAACVLKILDRHHKHFVIELRVAIGRREHMQALANERDIGADIARLEARPIGDVGGTGIRLVAAQIQIGLPKPQKLGMMRVEIGQESRRIRCLAEPDEHRLGLGRGRHDIDQLA